ncbi:MAG: hypothetical protein E7578_04365, partial [Ruminococcaceae bacterium]|nr:hypothetical protein [Oscillospiraceae bacterium]
CKAEYGSTNPSNHADLKKVAAKAPTCAEIGWNAYEYCTKCAYTTYNELPATGNHTGGTATCTSKAVCSVCKAEYGNVDPTNHAGETHVEGKTEATNDKEGYTGDTYCNDCGEKIAEGEIIPALIIRGDVNGDGTVDSSDITALRRMIVGADIEVSEGADYNNDGSINVADITAIRRVIAGAIL